MKTLLKRLANILILLSLTYFTCWLFDLHFIGFKILVLLMLMGALDEYEDIAKTKEKKVKKCTTTQNK